MKNPGTTSNEGNIDVAHGETTRIHPAAYGMLMELLSDIYGNAMKAVLREYATNGWDEHRKHKVDRPIEVTLPSALQPTLTIRDFGAGLRPFGRYEIVDGEKICVEMGVMEVFGEYGHSTKRDTNDQAGHFGIGSKSAFALGQQFVVTGYRDGYEFTALFTLNDDGTGTKTIQHEGPTKEPNGVEITLGVEQDDMPIMHETAREFFQFWDRGTVLVDAEEPTPIFERLQKVNDEIYVDTDEDSVHGEAYAVMGPVAYPIDRALLRKVSNHLSKSGLGEEAARLPLTLVDNDDTDLYLRVPIGGVKPAPNREALRDKESTVRTLASIFLGLHQDSVVKVQNEVSQAPSYFAAAKAFAQANEALGAFKVDRKAISWNGQPVNKTQHVVLRNYQLVQRSWRSQTKVVGDDSTATAEFPGVSNWLVVTGVTAGNEGVVRRYAKRFLEDNEHGITRVLVTSAEAASFGWFQFGVEQGARTWNLDAWRAALKTMRKSNPRTVNEPSYTTGFDRASRDLDDRDLLSDIISEGKDLVLFNESSARCDRFEREVLKDYTVVVLLATQSENALRNRVADDGSVSIVEWNTLKPLAQKAAQKVVDSFTDAEREALGAREWLSDHQSTRTSAQTLVTGLRIGGELKAKTLLEVEDSFLLAEEFAAGLTDERYRELSYAFRATGQGDIDGSEIAYEDEVVDISARYPLLPTPRIRDAIRNMRQHRKTLEDGTVKYDAWYYDEKKYTKDLRMLEHAVRYVNSIG